jgi:hypothetical protein
MIWVRAIAAIAVIGCGKAGGGTDKTPVGSNEPGLGGRPTLGQSGAEGGGACYVYGPDAPPNVPFDSVVAPYGFSGADVAAAARGSHTVEVVRAPWFEAPSHDPQMRKLTLDIAPKQKAYNTQCAIEVVADVRVRDVESGVEASMTGRLSASASDQSDPHLGAISLITDFDSPELAHALALPPAAEHDQDADRFELSAHLDDGSWSAGLASLRGENSCGVLASAAPVGACSDYADSMGVSAPQRVSTSEAFADQHIEDLVAAVQDLPALSMKWPNGEKTSLRIDAEPEDFACIGRRHLVTSSESDIVQKDDRMLDVALVPLTLHVTTQDGKLDAKLPAFVSASAVVGEAWHGEAELDSALAPISALTDTDWDAIADLPDGDIGLASLMLALPLDENADYARFFIEAHRPYAGEPAYPELYEYASNRIDCFGSSNGGTGYEIPLKPAD